MSWFPRPVSPRAAFRDLFTFMRHSSREQRIGAALALLVTAIIVIEFLVDPMTGAPPPQEITYVQLYPSNRTDAEIIADQKKDMLAKIAAQKEQQRQATTSENDVSPQMRGPAPADERGPPPRALPPGMMEGPPR